MPNWKDKQKRYDDDEVVALAAVFYDDEGNTYETPFVKATIDETMPDITLSVNEPP